MNLYCQGRGLLWEKAFWHILGEGGECSDAFSKVSATPKCTLGRGQKMPEGSRKKIHGQTAKKIFSPDFFFLKTH